MNNRGLEDFSKIKSDKIKPDFEGKSGYCYICDDKIIKIYANGNEHGIFIPPDSHKVCDFSNYSADTIVFPMEYIYENGKIIGEISTYIKNKQLNEAFNEHTIIKKIFDGYEKVQNDLQTYNNINMIDICYVNILYSNKNGFHIIDTTDWQFQDNSYKINIYRFNWSLTDVTIEYANIPLLYGKCYHKVDENYYNNMAKYGNAGKRLQKNTNMIMVEKYRFLEWLYAYMEVYRIHYGEEMKTLKGVKEMTKVLKKG